MPPLTHVTEFYDVHDFKVYPLTADSGASPTYGAGVDVPGIAEVGLDPNFVTAVLKGDARVIARKGRIDGFQFAATYSQLSLDVLAVIMEGETTDESDDHARFRILGDNSLPYFGVAFKIEDLAPGVGDLHVIGYKGQLTGGTLLGSQTDQFGQPTAEIGCLPTAAGDLFLDIDLYRDVTALPASL